MLALRCVRRTQRLRILAVKISVFKSTYDTAEDEQNWPQFAGSAEAAQDQITECRNMKFHHENLTPLQSSCLFEACPLVQSLTDKNLLKYAV